MMSVLATWSLVAALFGVILAGLGLAMRRAVSAPLVAGLILPLGFSALLVIGAFASLLGLSPTAVLIVLVPVALFGLTDLLPLRRVRPSAAALWGGGAVVVTWLIYAGIVASTGQATFGGYNIVGDPAIHLVGADAILGGGGPWAAKPGSFKAFFDGYYGTGYPVGGASALALLSSLSGLDPIETLQPLLATSMAVFVSAVWVLLTPVIAPRWLRAGCSVLVAVPSLTFSFVLQSSLKEVLAITAIASACAACVLLWPQAARDEDDPRRPTILTALRTTLSIAIPVAAVVAAIGPAGVVYAAPAFAVVLVGALITSGWRFAIMHGAVVAVLALVLVIPSLFDLSGYVAVSGTVLTTQAELGTLYLGPIDTREVLGLWIGSDFRVPAREPEITYDGGTLVIVLAILGGLRVLQLAVRRRPAAIPLIAWMVSSAAATIFIVDAGSPWADAKALAIAAPTVMAGAVIGIAALWVSKWTRVVSAAAGLAVVALVGWSIALVSYDLTAMPEDRFEELSTIDARFAGQGPMITAEWEEFVRHSLRNVPGTFGADGYVQLPFAGPFGSSGDQDDFALETTESANLMLVRSGPAASRPPSNFSRVWSGRWYEVWRRSASQPAPRVHLGLGSLETGGTARPTCRDVDRFVAGAQPGEEVVAAVRSPVSNQALGELPLPVAWTVDGSDSRIVRPYGRGTFRFTLEAPSPGTKVDVWWEGSFNREAVMTANGQRATIGPMALNSRRSATRMMTVRADAQGRVEIVVERPGRAIRAGAGNTAALWGPVSITPHDPLGTGRLLRLKPSEARDVLCSREFDWIELVPSGS